MTQFQAVEAIAIVVNHNRLTKGNFKLLMKACKTLNFTEEQTTRICAIAEYDYWLDKIKLQEGKL